MKLKTPDLTVKEAEVYQLIQKHKVMVERWPTVRQLVKWTHVKSTATVQAHIQALRSKGYL